MNGCKIIKQQKRKVMTQRDEGHDFRDSKNKAKEYERKQMVDKQMVNYWLDDNYQTWIADVLVELVNDKNPRALPNLQKEIKDAWDQRSEAN